ncbi:MAG: sodium:alanine symporter family protein [Lachnospiraceae bacterium]|nr:sodium:alanine symporter family protein [Lachnospiraceae bacterium]
MHTLFSLITQIGDFLWTLPMLILLIGTHLYFTFRLSFIQKKTFLGIRLSLKGSQGEGELSPYEALSTSLAATIGTGNIIGISTAIAIGGAGAVFWCWLTGVFGIATSYAESFLCVKYRRREADGSYVGGPMYVLRDVLHLRWLAGLFALFAMLAAFGVGSSVQAQSICTALRQYVPLSPHLIGMGLSMLAGCVLLGGVRQISKVCACLVPFMSLFYLSGCAYLLIANRRYLASSLFYILKSAFCGDALLGGISGQAALWAVRIGVSRGLFTNEAGLGSLPMSAAAARCQSPVTQALISMTGTFWDTVVICAVTGLVIVSSMQREPALFTGARPEQLCSLAFGLIPGCGSAVLSIALILFAFATILGWCYYGECGVRFLCKEKGIRNFRILYLVFLYIGSISSLHFVFALSDLLNALMAMPNLLALFALRKTIRADTAAYFSGQKCGTRS